MDHILLNQINRKSYTFLTNVLLINEILHVRNKCSEQKDILYALLI